MRKLADEKISTVLYSDPDDIFSNVNLGNTTGFSTAFADSSIASISVDSATFASVGTVGTLSVTAAQQELIDDGTEYVFEFDYEISITANPSTASWQFNIAEVSSSTDVDISITNLSGTIRWTARTHSAPTAVAHSYIVTLEGRTTDTGNPTTGSATFSNAIFGVAYHQQTSETILLGGTLHGLVAVAKVGTTAVSQPENTTLTAYYSSKNVNDFTSATYTSFYTKTFGASETVAVDEEFFRYIANSEKEMYYRFRIQSSTSATGTFDLKLASVKKN